MLAADLPDAAVAAQPGQHDRQLLLRVGSDVVDRARHRTPRLQQAVHTRVGTVAGAVLESDDLDGGHLRSSRRRSRGSLVSTASPRRAALAITLASTMSETLALAQSSPALFASASSSGSTVQAFTICASRACRGPRQACASAAAGMTGTISRATLSLQNTQKLRSFRSPAIKAPVSSVNPASATSPWHAPLADRTCSCSHSSSSRRPASSFSRCSTASATNADRLRPVASAASRVRCAKSGSKDTDSFSTATRKSFTVGSRVFAIQPTSHFPCSATNPNTCTLQGLRDQIPRHHSPGGLGAGADRADFCSKIRARLG